MLLFTVKSYGVQTTGLSGRLYSFLNINYSNSVTIHSQYHNMRQFDSLLAKLAYIMILTGISHFTYMKWTAAIAAVGLCKAVLPACRAECRNKDKSMNVCKWL